MELGLYELFKTYEMEVETHLHEQIENQLGFHELKIAFFTRVDKLWDGTRV